MVPKLGFFAISQIWFFSFPGNYIGDSLEHCLTTGRGKTHEKSFGAPNWVQNQGFLFSQGCIKVFLDIAQGCSLVQCLTSSRTETSPKYFFVAQIGAEMIFSILLSSVHSNLLVSTYTWCL